MKIKTKLIASAVALTAVAAVPCFCAYADFATCTNNVDNGDFYVDLGTTQECNLVDNSAVKNLVLSYIQCTAGNFSNIFMSNSYEWVYARTQSSGRQATVTVYASFLDENDKIILSDSSVGNTVTFAGGNISDVTNSSFIKEGHILVKCSAYKLSAADSNHSVDTYVNYGFGY